LCGGEKTKLSTTTGRVERDRTTATQPLIAIDDSQVVLSIMRAMREWCKQFRKKESVMTTTTTTQQSREGTTSQKRKTKNLPVVDLSQLDPIMIIDSLEEITKQFWGRSRPPRAWSGPVRARPGPSGPGQAQETFLEVIDFD
jgi:hypothetical protein